MNKESKQESRIVSWPFQGWTATGIIDKAGYVIVAVDYKMDFNIEKGDLWWADMLYTNEVCETDWSLVRPATAKEVNKLLFALGKEKMNDIVGEWYEKGRRVCDSPDKQ